MYLMSRTTWMNNCSRTPLLSAAKLCRCFGGKTPRGCRWVVWSLSLSATCLRELSDPRTIGLTQGKIAVGQHDQGHVTVHPGPEPALVVVQPQFSLGILVEALDYPATVSQFNLILKAHSVKSPGEVPNQ